MKKILLAIIASVAICASASAQQTVGGGLSFSNSEVGIAVRYTYAWENIRLAPELVLFFPEVGTAVDLNVNVHYTFNIAPKFSLYPLGGFCLRIRSWGDQKFWGNTVVKGGSDAFFGLNLGGGCEYNFTNDWSAFGEIKGIFGQGSSSAFTLGVVYRF